ncbi:MAG: DNA/RNA nuclease SfsA [candidate division Zixibacteria bacterium]|nr:DNA/RNA nuclease SfsA [candidate division Zixibacteria bacterium]
MMFFDFPLVKSRFIKRVNRFTCEVEIKRETTLAHLHDPGRLDTVLKDGMDMYLRKATGGNRKTGYDIILARRDKEYILINTSFSNLVAAELIQKGKIPKLEGFSIIRPEFKYKDSRFDFLLNGPEGAQMLLEVKAVTKARNKLALFPDAPTERGQRHLRTLSVSLDDGYVAGIMFVAFRNHVTAFSPDSEIDPEFARLLSEANQKGVRTIVVKTDITKGGVEFDKILPVKINGN